MGALRWTALLLALLLRGEGGSVSSVHSLRYFLTVLSEPVPGMPSVVTVGCVDGQCFERYDSHIRRDVPTAPWMEKVTEDDPQYWDQETILAQSIEEVSRGTLDLLQKHYNQRGGLHTFQAMYGCDLNEDVPSRGHFRFGYEGRDIIAFDQETLTWTAPDAVALITKRNLEAEPAFAQPLKNYLEEECIDWLRKFLRYGNQTLLRKEPPAVKVTRKGSQEGLETLLCQAHGFYPKEIDITWRKDGEVRHEDTFHGVVSPNADGTYYAWLSINIDCKERSHYRCHVEHDGLQDPLDVAVEESVAVWIIIVGLVLGVLVSLAVAGVILYIKAVSALL